MSKARDIADSAATINALDGVTATGTELNILDGVTATTAELNILDGVTATTAELNYVDGVTSNLQTQLDNISVTSGTLTKTFALNEVATITLSSSVTTPVVSVTKEVNQTGVTNNRWDVNSTTENYTRLDSATATTLSFDADLANGSYAKNFSVTGEETVPKSLKFNNDGTKLFVVGTTGDDVNEYTLSTAYDISTMSFVDSFNIASQCAEPVGLEFNSDGTKMYVLDQNNRNIFQYSLTAFDVSTASYDSVSFSVGTQETTPSDIVFNNDGTKIFVSGLAGDDINEYTLSTAYDISTMSFVDSFSVTSQSIFSPQSVAFNSDGTKMYVLSNDTPDTVFQYSLTAFDVSTASYDSISFAINTNSDNAQGITFSPDGTKMYIADDGANTIDQYTIPRKLTLGSGSFASADVGKTIEANSGKFVLTSAAGAFSETTAPTSYAQVASGSWEMYAVVYNTTDGDLELSKTQQNTYDISTASFSQSFSVNTEDGLPRGMAFNNDGTKMYMVGSATDNVYQYTLTTGFDVSTASYDSVSLNVGPQDTEPQGIAWNNDGTKLYLVGRTGSDLNEYTLTTAFDISTATYNDRFALSGIETTPTDMAWNNDGTKAFVIGETGDMVYEFSVSTAYDITSLTYVRGQSVSAKDTEPTGMAFNSDGTKLYFIGSLNDSIHEYDLGSAFNLTSMTFNQSFSVTSQDTNPQCLRFNSDGSKIYAIGTSSDSVHEYTIGTTSIPTGYHAVHTTTSTDSTYWTDINSMTVDETAGDGSIFYCVSTDDRSTWKIAHNTNGIRSIVRNNSGTWQYNSNGTYASTTWTNATTNTELNALQEAMTGAVQDYSLANASYDNNTISTSSNDTSAQGIAINNDGTKVYLVGNQFNAVFQYTMTTAYDLSTASMTQSSSISSQSSSPMGIRFNDDGTKMYISEQSGTIYQYTLTTAFDLNTSSYASISFSTSSESTSLSGLDFNSDGTKMYVLGGSVVYQYSLSTAYNVSTASYDSVSFSVSTQDSNARDVTFNSDGTKMFIAGGANDTVYQYNLSSAFDISTASYASVSFSVTSQQGFPTGIAFSSDGLKLFLSGNSTSAIHRYSTVGDYPNQMNKTQLDAVSDANHFTLANDLDLGIIFNLSSGTTVPSSDGVSINYDANVLNKGAILGTDYDFDAPAATKVRITALAANNLKVRVV